MYKNILTTLVHLIFCAEKNNNSTSGKTGIN